MIQLRVISSTDGKWLGTEVSAPIESLGTLNKRQIQALATTILDGRFIPDSVAYPSPGKVRLINPNYSVTLEEVSNG